MAKRYKFRYTVEGRGEFPFDMLRYECSYPASEQESRLLTSQASIRAGRRSVALVHFDTWKGWTPAEDRWKSFLWRVRDTRPPEVTCN